MEKILVIDKLWEEVERRVVSRQPVCLLIDGDVVKVTLEPCGERTDIEVNILGYKGFNEPIEVRKAFWYAEKCPLFPSFEAFKQIYSKRHSKIYWLKIDIINNVNSLILNGDSNTVISTIK